MNIAKMTTFPSRDHTCVACGAREDGAGMCAQGWYIKVPSSNSYWGDDTFACDFCAQAMLATGQATLVSSEHYGEVEP